MLFNSLDFAVFITVVFSLYWFVTQNNLKWQNFLIAAASYVFYGWWDWRFLSLILFSTIVDYSIGRLLGKQEKESNRKLLLWGSIIVNLGLLGFFKYYNFFLENFVEAFSFFGRRVSVNSLNIVLPVGISFYTFQTLSYTIDVYKRKLEPTSNFIDFAAFVSFFPQLVAGPIERASNLLPQFKRRRKFEYSEAIDGLRQILWGLVKKVIVADNCAQIVNQVFSNSSELNGSSLLLGAFFFAFQIYGDFSGYSDIAIGTARLFGFNLMQNFAFPYFSRDIAEFWRRWHISLSTWFRDYLYIPLGGSKGSTLMKVRNTFIIFVVSGFWHGANWTFIVWGALNAVYFLPLLLAMRNRKNTDLIAEGKLLPSLTEFFGIVTTFSLVMISWVFFRAENLNHAFDYLAGLFSYSLFEVPDIHGKHHAFVTLCLVLTFMSVEWLGRHEKYAIEKLGMKWKRPIRYALYYTIIFLIFTFGGGSEEFIYFQF